MFLSTLFFRGSRASRSICLYGTWDVLKGFLLFFCLALHLYMAQLNALCVILLRSLFLISFRFLSRTPRHSTKERNDDEKFHSTSNWQLNGIHQLNYWRCFFIHLRGQNKLFVKATIFGYIFIPSYSCRHKKNE